MTNIHASKCVLNSRCNVANTPACSPLCEFHIGVNGRLNAAGLPADYRLVTLQNSPARAGQTKVYEAIDAYVQTFERQFDEGSPRIKSLYLYSESPGTGKTTSAACVLNAYLTEHYVGSLRRGQQPQQRPAYFLDVNSFQTDYNLATMTKDERGLAEIKATIQRTQTAPFAVLDDIGVRSASEAFRSYVHAIVNYRATNGLATVFTSNLPIEEMTEVFDHRLQDRMRDQCATLSFIGESKRGRR